MDFLYLIKNNSFSYLIYMKHLIHRLCTDLKFLYPCITGDKSYTESELIIEAETRLNKIYPLKMAVANMTSIGEDYWGRYTFKDEHDQYYCELDGDLYFKGKDIDGEPQYPIKKEITYIFPDVDKELSLFNPCIEKVREYFLKSEEVELVDIKTWVEEDKNNILNSKIQCLYTIKLK